MAWATISEEERDGLNVALNEATWAGIGVDATARRARLLLEVLSLPADDSAAADSHVIFTVNQVSRIAASLRMGRWNDTAAQVIPLALEDLDAAVGGFGDCPVYGWEFIDPPEESWSNWRDRLSVDVRPGQDESPHVIDLFQEGGSAESRHLDLRIWSVEHVHPHTWWQPRAEVARQLELVAGPAALADERSGDQHDRPQSSLRRPFGERIDQDRRAYRMADHDRPVVQVRHLAPDRPAPPGIIRVTDRRLRAGPRRRPSPALPPREDRIVRLGLHHHVTSSIGHDVNIDAWWTTQ